jgi:hypothetical protein
MEATMKNAILAAALVALGCSTKPVRELEPTPAPVQMRAAIRRTPPVYRPLGDTGAQEAVLYRVPLPDLGGQLEVRIIGVGQGEPVTIPTDHELSLEVRTGNAVVTTDGQRVVHAAGDIWVVPKGARVTIAAEGEATVLRAMYLIMS